ncbi:unnamed protein product [Paramecium pentaurelia]|uniref:RING-type domain-containing protein n=1 Tax=Paramecium pentaurelia TaxID=43138 RepID=A0A8S1TS39_9CILI|nr:unnamed protein product [Paramecium pentaurelia]
MDQVKYFIRNLIIKPQSIDQNLLCLICQEFVIDPQECQSCQTLFCTFCINQWLQNQQTCPNMCKQIILSKPHRMFQNAIQQILVKCENHGCEQQMKLEDFENHRKNCKNKLNFSKELSNFLGKGQISKIYCDKCNTQFIIFEHHECIKSLNHKIKEVQTNFQQFQQHTNKIIADLLQKVIQYEQKQLISSQSRIIPQCVQGHILKWIYPQNNALCQNCKLSTSAARYICEQCRTYYCQQCRKPQFKDGVCPIGHALQFNIQALPQVYCDYCLENIFSRGESVYQDRFCDLDICNSCYNSLQNNYQ